MTAAANLRSIFSRLRKDAAGAAFVEFAFLATFLVMAFLGMLEISMFISARERMNKIADQVSDTLGTITTYSSDGNNFVEYRNAYRAMDEIGFPHGAYLSFRFCHGRMGFESPAFGAPANSGGTIRDGRCGMMSGTAEKIGPRVARCSDAKAGGGEGGEQEYQQKYPNSQFVVVIASCDYKPTINLFGYFLRGRIVSQAVTPLRRIMTWNN